MKIPKLMKLLLQKTILDLLKHKEAEKIFAEENNLKTHKKFVGITDDLEKLYHEQQQNPQTDISQKLKNIRLDIEQTD